LTCQYQFYDYVLCDSKLTKTDPCYYYLNKFHASPYTYYQSDTVDPSGTILVTSLPIVPGGNFYYPVSNTNRVFSGIFYTPDGCPTQTFFIRVLLGSYISEFKMSTLPCAGCLG
jgi:hypothetical protein